MPEKLPIWNAVGVEPPELLKTDGWQPGMKPSAQHMNWLFSRIYKCLEEIQAGGGTEELEQELATLQQALATHMAEDASVTKKGHVQLSSAVNSASETTAATSKAVKDAKDFAIAEIPKWAGLYGLGGTAKDISGTNLNDLVGSGTYMGVNMGGAPTGADWYFVEHMRHNEKYAKQTAHPFTGVAGNTRTFMRVQNNGVWGKWTTVMISDDTRPMNANLDNYTTPGFYSLGGDTVNGPSANFADWGIVVTYVSTDNIYQEVMGLTGERATRFFTPAWGWQPWSAVPKGKRLHLSVPANGVSNFTFAGLENFKEIEVRFIDVRYGTNMNSQMKVNYNDGNTANGSFRGTRLDTSTPSYELGASISLVHIVSAGAHNAVIDAILNIKKIRNGFYEVKSTGQTGSTRPDLYASGTIAGYTVRGAYAGIVSKLTFQPQAAANAIGGVVEIWVVD